MKKTILLADDDGSVRQMVGRVLESAGYTVTQAGNREEAAAGFRMAKPDLVVWDLEMPCPEGWGTLGLEGESGNSVPVVGTTAWPNQDENALRRGIRALMEKPLDLRLLLRTIHDLLAADEKRNGKGLAAVT